MMLKKKKNDFDIFGGFFDDPFFNESRHKEIMKTDIKEGENEYTLEIEMPGIKKENVKIELSKGYITISAENDNEVEEKEKNYIRKERHYGSFTRSFYVGDKVEMNDIKASMDNGILSITVPKEEPEEPEKKYIEIK